MVYVDPKALESESGVWHPQRLLVNRPVTIPSTDQEHAAEIFEVGSIHTGITDPNRPDFDSSASWATLGQSLEIRLPYMAIGFTDPSSLQVLKITSEGSVKTEDLERIGISIVWDGILYKTGGYAWETWNAVHWHERPKVGIERFALVVRQTN